MNTNAILPRNLKLAVCASILISALGLADFLLPLPPLILPIHAEEWLIGLLAAVTLLAGVCGAYWAATAICRQRGPFRLVAALAVLVCLYGVLHSITFYRWARIPPLLSGRQIHQLAEDVNELVLQPNNMADSGAVRRSYWPASVRQLRPLAVYYDGLNLRIALWRHGKEERGFYVEPVISSFRIEFGGKPLSDSEGWGYKPVGAGIYEYRLKL